MPGSTLLDLYSLVRQGSPESEALRQQILAAELEEPVRTFWPYDFLRDYRRSDLQAPKHKLSKLVAAGTVSLMLSQPEDRIDLRRIMDEGRILLVDLSSVSRDAGLILGSLLTAIVSSTARSRIDTPEDERERFCVYANEAPLVMTADAIENFAVHGRVLGVDLCIAYQRLAQFHTAGIDAISIFGTTIVDPLDTPESQQLARNIQGLAAPRDMTTVERHEMIAHIGAELLRFRTLPLPGRAPCTDVNRLLEESRRQYCAPAEEIRAQLRHSDSDNRSALHP